MLVRIKTRKLLPSSAGVTTRLGEQRLVTQYVKRQMPPPQPLNRRDPTQPMRSVSRFAIYKSSDQFMSLVGISVSRLAGSSPQLMTVPCQYAGRSTALCVAYPVCRRLEVLPERRQVKILIHARSTASRHIQFLLVTWWQQRNLLSI